MVKGLGFYFCTEIVRAPLNPPPPAPGAKAAGPASTANGGAKAAVPAAALASTETGGEHLGVTFRGWVQGFGFLVFVLCLLSGPKAGGPKARAGPGMAQGSSDKGVGKGACIRTDYLFSCQSLRFRAGPVAENPLSCSHILTSVARRNC